MILKVGEKLNINSQKLKASAVMFVVLLLAQMPYSYLTFSNHHLSQKEAQNLHNPLVGNTVFKTPLKPSPFLTKPTQVKPQTLASINEPDRMFQAKELLGKYYDKSIVRTGENVAGIENYIYEYVRANIHKSWKKKSRAIAREIIKQGNKWNLDPIFILSMIENESKFTVDVIGGVGEIGLMQVRPETAAWIAKEYKLKWKGKNDLFDPVKNIKIGTAYVSYLREKHGFHSRLYLSAYNMGSANVHRALAKQIWPKDYASKVMQFYVKNYSNLSAPAEFVNREGAFRAPTTAHPMD